MNLLPIVERELRSASVRPGTYWSRVWIGFLGIAILGTAILMTQFVPLGVFGPASVFKAVRFFGLIYCLVSGVRLTSDCISREKREGTLGFLFLTPLRGYDVILGKLISKGVLPLYTMMVIVPLVWLISLVGGITAGEQFYTVVAIGNALFFSLAVGIAVSTFFRDRRRCELIASATVFLLFFGLFPFADMLIQSLLTTTAETWVAGSTPVEYLVNRVNTLANPFFSGTSGIHAAMISNMVVHLTSWALIVMASWWAPRCWRERPPAGARVSLREWWRQWTYGTDPKRALRRKAVLDVNPFFWRATRNRLRPLIPWMFIVLTLGIALLISVSTGFSAPGFYGFLVFTVVCWYLAPKLWFAHTPSRSLARRQVSPKTHHPARADGLRSHSVTLRDSIRHPGGDQTLDTARNRHYTDQPVCFVLCLKNPPPKTGSSTPQRLSRARREQRRFDLRRWRSGLPSAKADCCTISRARTRCLRRCSRGGWNFSTGRKPPSNHGNPPKIRARSGRSSRRGSMISTKTASFTRHCSQQ